MVRIDPAMIPSEAAAAAAGQSRSVVPEEEEDAALAISDQRTLYLVNIFISHTSRFLNSFSSLCQDKLAQVHRRILRLDANLSILEAQLRNTCPMREFENRAQLKGACSSSELVP